MDLTEPSDPTNLSDVPNLACTLNLSDLHRSYELPGPSNQPNSSEKSKPSDQPNLSDFFLLVTISLFWLSLLFLILPLSLWRSSQTCHYFLLLSLVCRLHQTFFLQQWCNQQKPAKYYICSKSLIEIMFLHKKNGRYINEMIRLQNTGFMNTWFFL